MLLCRCLHLLPGDSIFCPFCTRSLNRRYCGANHPNPLWNTRACLICGQAPLTPGTYALPLGWVMSMMTLLLILWGWHWVEHHPGKVALALWQAGSWMLSIFFDAPPHRVHSALAGMLAWYITLWLLSFCLPGSMGKQARHILRALPKQAWRGIRLVAQTVGRVALPSRTLVKKSGGRPKGRDKETDEANPF